jgi:hypothetical protein
METPNTFIFLLDLISWVQNNIQESSLNDRRILSVHNTNKDKFWNDLRVLVPEFKERTFEFCSSEEFCPVNQDRSSTWNFSRKKVSTF